MDLLVELDEGVVMSALKRLRGKEGEKGFRISSKHFEKEGTKVAIVPKEKSFWKSKKFWGGVITFIISPTLRNAGKSPSPSSFTSSVRE